MRRNTNRKIVGDSAYFQVARRSQRFVAQDDATMANNWDSEMQDKFDKLQAALTKEFRTQLKAMAAELDERLEQRLVTRLNHRLDVQAEQLREIVRTAADNYGGVLTSIKGDLADFRDEWRKETADTRKVLANHGGRIEAIEEALSNT